MSAVLEVAELHKRFDATAILQGVSLGVKAGERLAVVGPNGAGKSTLFNIISGRLAPTSGRVMLNGRSIAGLAPHQIHRMGLARSFQITQVFTRLTVEDNLRCASLAGLGHGLNMFRRLSQMRDVSRHVAQLMEQLGLGARRQVPAGELSYAEQRRLELGMTLAGRSSVILLDEPTAGMSHSETRQVVGLIREMTQGKTLLMVEHDMGAVFELADRIAVLDQGVLIACGSPDAVRADHRVQQAYLGAWTGEEGSHAAC